MSPDERALREDLGCARFQIGIADGRWQCVDVAWPHLTVSIASTLVDNVSEYHFRFDCTDYPHQAPTGSIWDLDGNTPLQADRRPPTRGRAAKIFRTDWPGHAKGAVLYHPYDREAAGTHAEWPAKQPRLLWTPSHTITDLLDELHAVLNVGDAVHA